MKRISITKSKAIRDWEKQSPLNAIRVLDAISIAFDLQKFALGDSRALDKYRSRPTYDFFTPGSIGWHHVVDGMKKAARMTVCVYDTSCEEPEASFGGLAVAMQFFDKKNLRIESLSGLRFLFSFGDRVLVAHRDHLDGWRGEVSAIPPDTY